MATVEVQQLAKRFGAIRAVDGLDLQLPDAQLTVVLGPSGCGKTTLLRLIAGLEQPTAGRVMIDGVDVTRRPARDRDVAMVFQHDALYPHMTVEENMAFGLRLRGASAEVIRQRISETAAAVEIQPLLRRLPGELSGGQRQRAAVARAVARRPKVLLLDEPLSHLDALRRGTLRSELARLQRRLGLTMIHVTHDQTEAMELGQRIIVMRDGCCLQQGRPLQVYDRPRSRFVAEFLGAPPMNFLPARWADGVLTAGRTSLPLPAAAAPQTAASGLRDLLLGVRPEAVRIAGDGDLRLAATVEAVRCLGCDTLVELGWAGEKIVARLAGRLALTEGEQVELTVDSGELRWFDAETEEAL